MATASANQRFLVVVRSPLLLLLLLTAALCLIGPVRHTAAAPHPKIRAVNLGGWLVIEGFITPTLFDDIPNNDLLDGRQLQFQSVTTGKYLSAENGGGSTIVADRTIASEWETFKLWRVDENNFQFKVSNSKFWGLVGDGGNSVVATATNPGWFETFQIVRDSKNPNRTRIKAHNGFYLRANSETSVTAEARGTGDWGDGDRSVFIMKFVGSGMHGEFQLTNGYGPEKATTKLQNHWSTYIVEDDFQYLRDNGLNAVRIPVGWWIAFNPAPKPFVAGSLQKLDNAFTWADKYGLGVIVDLHAAPGGQNHDEHSGSRDGTVAWGTYDQSIQQSVQAIDFLASRYANRQSLLGIELLNEPRAPEVPLDALLRYYRLGYDAVRKYTSQAYVLVSSRLGADPAEVLDLASGLQRTVVDVHYYNLYDRKFEKLSAQENIDYVLHKRTEQIRYVTRANGPLVFVGEWSTAWNVEASNQLGQYAAAQLQVFGQATFGWAFWTYKRAANNDFWSLKWMIENGYIRIN